MPDTINPDTDDADIFHVHEARGARNPAIFQADEALLGLLRKSCSFIVFRDEGDGAVPLASYDLIRLCSRAVRLVGSTILPSSPAESSILSDSRLSPSAVKPN